MYKSILAATLLFLAGVALADEGMWTIDNFPSSQVADKYGVEISDDWLRSAQLATTRLENGCTGSFASPDGLVLTNNHCVWGCIRNLSNDERNLSDQGFIAATRDEELRCPGQQISVLLEFEDVTDKINEATEDLADAEANTARKAELTNLEAACEDAADSAIVIAAATNYETKGCDVLSYEHPFGVGYLVAVFHDGGASDGD